MSELRKLLPFPPQKFASLDNRRFVQFQDFADCSLTIACGTMESTAFGTADQTTSITSAEIVAATEYSSSLADKDSKQH